MAAGKLAIEARGAHITVSWNGDSVISARDRTLQNEGAVGLWVRSPDVARFDELTIEPLGDSRHGLELVPLFLKKSS